MKPMALVGIGVLALGGYSLFVGGTQEEKRPELLKQLEPALTLSSLRGLKDNFNQSIGALYSQMANMQTAQALLEAKQLEALATLKDAVVNLGNTTTQVVETVRSNPQQLYMDITSGTVSIDQQVEAIKSIGGSVPKTTITDTAQKTYEEAKAVFKAPAML